MESLQPSRYRWSSGILLSFNERRRATLRLRLHPQFVRSVSGGALEVDGRLERYPARVSLTLSSQHVINARFALVRSEQSFSVPAGPSAGSTRPNSNPFRFCGGSVFEIPARGVKLYRRALARSFRWKAMPKHVYIFLKTDIVEDSLCAPGLPMLRSKDVGWYPAS